MSTEERLLKALESPKTQEALAEIVERIDVLRDLVRTLWEFKRSGVLDDLLQLATTLRFITEGLLTPGFIEKVAKLQEVALTAAVNMLYPYYGWGAMDVEAYFEVSEANPVEATRVVMKVPFGITELVVRRQLTGFPIYEGTVALEYLDHVEFGEVVHVEPQPFAILTNNTALRLVEVPVEEDAVVFMMRGKRGV